MIKRRWDITLYYFLISATIILYCIFIVEPAMSSTYNALLQGCLILVPAIIVYKIFSTWAYKYSYLQSLNGLVTILAYFISLPYSITCIAGVTFFRDVAGLMGLLISPFVAILLSYSTLKSR